MTSKPTAPKFNQLILVAPDIDRELFRRDVAALASRAESITIYVSEKDKALLLSREINGYPRLGEAGENLDPIDGVETVDLSTTGIREVSGHLYHLHNPAVITDIARVLRTGVQIGSETYRRVPASNGSYWKLVLVEASERD